MKCTKKNKRDVTDVALSLLGWRRISEWDEYNLKINHNNEKTMETEIIQAQKYAVQLKNYIIAEKQHSQRRIDLLESEMQKALNDTNEKTINTIIELSMMELVWIIEGQVVDIRRQLDAIGHSIDRNRKITTTEIYDIIKDKETITKIEETCGIHKRTSLNRTTIFTKNTEKFLNATITIPIYENTPLHVYKLTAIPQITGNNTIIIPSMEAAYIATTKNSLQYIEIENKEHVSQKKAISSAKSIESKHSTKTAAVLPKRCLLTTL